MAHFCSPAGGVAALTVLAALAVVVLDYLLGRRFAWVQYIIVGAGLLALLLVPFSMFAQKELAPIEDQGVVFSAACCRRPLRLSTRTSFTRSRCRKSSSR